MAKFQQQQLLHVAKQLAELRHVTLSHYNQNRKMVKFQIRCDSSHLNCENELVLNIYAYSKYLRLSLGDCCLFQKDLESLNFTNLEVFLVKVFKKIESLRECAYCNVAFDDASTDVCQDCFGYTLIVLEPEYCIICHEQTHPIKFRCQTCLGSKICLKCAGNPLCLNSCPTCKQPVKRLGRKRTRDQITSSDDEASDDDD